MAGKKKKTTTKGKTTKKKRRVNKAKLFIAVAMLFVVLSAGIFAVKKITTFTTTVVKNFNAIVGSSNNKNESKDKEKEVKEEKTKVEKKYTVLVDPGHGGNDGGTKSTKGSNLEKNISLEIGKEVASRLSKHNDVQVMITRTEDKYVALKDRVIMANTQDADLLVSIHLNGETGGNTAHGLETYYRKGATDSSKELAQYVQDSIVSYIGVRDRGIKEANYEVIQTSKIPSILVECGFLTNPAEEKKLKDKKYQEQMAEGIVQGVLSYLDNIEKQESINNK